MLTNYLITSALMVALILACRAWVNRTESKINWGLILCCLASTAVVAGLALWVTSLF